ncbi:hypothetical protein K4K49_004231 [Colletotrichum sp. SAR 10_70]|nr:hypothetical protein K4K49_004231 [Colletotrichum sp. SAR 10_70]
MQISNLNSTAAKQGGPPVSGGSNSTLESGVDESVKDKLPGSEVTIGSAASGAGSNRDIPAEEGGGVSPKTGQLYKAGDFEGPGGPEDKAKMEAQANPGSDEFAYLGRTSEEIYLRQKNDVEGTWKVMADLSRRAVYRQLNSQRQLQEVMVDFWSNLLHIPISADAAAYARADYDKVIRTYALYSFEALLQNAITHPAMGINLNNNVSRKYDARYNKSGPNENLGRELLELHTVGVGNYSEDDVKASARILTGYRVDLWPAFKAFHDTTWHDTQAVSVKGFTSANTAADGRAVTMAYLSHLARHPQTAARIARRLCVKFVRDDPSDSLVAAVTAAYTANDTRIRPTLEALVDHPDFAASVGMKLRSPQEDGQAMSSANLYVVARIARIEARRLGYDDAILLNRENRVAEATGACVVAYQNWGDFRAQLALPPLGTPPQRGRIVSFFVRNRSSDQISSLCLEQLAVFALSASVLPSDWPALMIPAVS